MPIYLVRWPGPSISIVKARDKTDLMDILDEVGDTSLCRIKEYRGPIFVSLDLELGYEKAENGTFSLKDVSQCLTAPEFKLAEDMGDTIYDMNNEILRFAFPAYHKYLNNRQEIRSGNEPDTQDELLCKAALEQDFTEPLEPSLKKRIDQSLKWAEAMGILTDQPLSDARDDQDTEASDD